MKFLILPTTIASILGAAAYAVAIAADAPASTPSPATASASDDLTTAQVAKLGWDAVPLILAHIKAPTFPNKDFPITDYGAKADGVTDCTDAIAKAIKACHDAGGGRVIIPDGTTLTGAVRLLSNVNLHLNSAKSTLQFVYDTTKYPIVYTRFESVEVMNYSPLIYAFEQENIAVTGDGVLDGSSPRGEGWQSQAFMRRGPGKEDPPIRAAQGIPVEQRIYGDNGALRPNFFAPFRCKNVLIEGVRIRNSPMWEINPVLCTNVIVRNLNISSLGTNNDGCDPECCKYVLIEGCVFDTGDDCIAIKSGKNDDGRRVNVPTEDVIIRNCFMKAGHGGVVLGSECTGGIRNVFAENCKMDSPSLNAILRFKNNNGRGGVIENVYARNIDVGSVSTGGAGLLIEYAYAQDNVGNFVPVLRNVNMSNIKGANVPVLVKKSAVANAVIENLNISNSTFAGPDPAVTGQYPGMIKFTDVKILPAGADVGAPLVTLAPGTTAATEAAAPRAQ